MSGRRDGCYWSRGGRSQQLSNFRVVFTEEGVLRKGLVDSGMVQAVEDDTRTRVGTRVDGTASLSMSRTSGPLGVPSLTRTESGVGTDHEP